MISIIGSLLFFFSFIGGLFYWVSILRPHLRERKITTITAANWGLSALSDWQMCRDHARKDPRSRSVATGYLLFLLAQLAGLALLLIGAVARF